MNPKFWSVIKICLICLLVGQSATAGELLDNGGFDAEQDGQGWTITTSGANSADGWYRINKFSRNGGWSRYQYLGAKDDRISAANNVDSTLYQTVAIPADATPVLLSYKLKISTEELLDWDADYLAVEIRKPNGELLSVPRRYSNRHSRQFSAWKTQTLDLSDYAGQRVQIAFHGTTNDATMTVFRVDDVSVQVGGHVEDAPVVLRPDVGRNDEAAAQAGEVAEPVEGEGEASHAPDSADGGLPMPIESNLLGTNTLYRYLGVETRIVGENPPTGQSQPLAAVNHPPGGVATATLPEGVEDTAYRVSATDLLLGFDDADNDSLSISGLTASNGSVVNNDGTYTVMPNEHFNGTMLLSYRVVDGHGGALAANQRYPVVAINDAPSGSATALLAEGSEDVAYTVSTADLLEGFGDADGDQLSISALRADNGSVVDNLEGSYTIMPGVNFHGRVVLSYRVVDGNGGAADAQLGYTLVAVNDAPTISGVAEAVHINDGATTTPFPTVNIGDVDEPPQSLQVTVTLDLAAKGTLSNLGGGRYKKATGVYSFSGTAAQATQAVRGLIFTPAPNRVAPTTSEATVLTLMVSDMVAPAVNASTTVVTISGNDPPTGSATASLPAGSEDMIYTVNTADLLAGFSDIDGDILKVSGVTSSDGVVTDNADATYSIAPSANFNGDVVLSYRVEDGNGGSVAARQHYTLAAVNDAPTGNPATVLAGGVEGETYMLRADDLLAGFSDVDGDSLSVDGLMSSNGAITDHLDGTFSIAPGANFHGEVLLSYKVKDDNGGVVDAKQRYTLAAVHRAPEDYSSATSTQTGEQAPAAQQASGSEAGAGLEEGINAYRQGDYRAALDIFTLLAAQGDAAAQFNLGVMSEMGQGVAQNYSEALSHYRRAAEQGHERAQLKLGVMYAQGVGTAPDQAESLRWFIESAEQGNAVAQFNLGVLHGLGQGVPQDDRQAALWFAKAAEQGNDTAQFNLGVMYANGLGVEQDDSTAIAWFRKAADVGNVSAQFNLGQLYREGKIVPQNYSVALSLLNQAAAQGSDLAQFELGMMYANGEGLQRDLTQAYKWFALAGGEEAGKQIALLESQMSGRKIKAAQALAKEWVEKHRIAE